MTGVPPVETVHDILGTAAAGQACEVEIGCGNGHFLAAYAAERPDTLLIGIDLKARRCRRAREKAEKRGLVHVHVLRGAAEELLKEFPPGSVDAFHIYFPDPWPKSRHRKRRFFTMETLSEMSTKLRPGGRLHFGTDFFDYYIQAKVLVALHGEFRLTEEPAPRQVLISMFGQRFVEANKAIRIFSAVREYPLGRHAERTAPVTRSPQRQGQQDEHERKVHQNVEADQHD